MENQISLNIDKTSFFRDIIYGKKEAYSIFLDTLENHKPESQSIVYVHGEIGVGKSYFIENIYSTLKNYNILYGKFEKIKIGTPYYGIKQIFKAIIKQVEGFPDDKKNMWKASFNNQFSSYYSELISLVPDFKSILYADKGSIRINTSPILLENRINDVLINFIQFFTEHNTNPTILTLENIQWIDIDSSNLIQNIIAKGYQNLLFVLSGRDENDSLTQFLTSSNYSDQIIDLHLKPLSHSEVSMIIDTMIHTNSTGVQDFKYFCYSQSKGNIQFLLATFSRLERNNQLSFDSNAEKWKVDFEHIDGNGPFIQNSPELSFEKMEAEHKLILQISACFGANLNTAFISRIGELQIEDINTAYQKALNIGLIKPAFIADNYISHSEGVQLGFDSPDFLKGEDGTLLITNFEFCTDLLQDKIKESFNKTESREVHKKIADYYLESSAIGLKDRDIFDAVYHFNKFIHDGSSLKQKQNHTILNLKAAKQAIKTASNVAGLTYIMECMKYDMHNNWSDEYVLASDVHLLGYEIARLAHNNSVANELFNAALLNCNKTDISRLKLKKIIVEIQHGELKDALSTGISALKSIGVHISPKANTLTILKEFIKTRIKMYNHSTKTILELPQIIDENSKIAQEIIFWMFRSAQYINPELNGVLALKSLQITLERGTNGNSYSGFMAYGVIVGAGTNNYKSAYTNCNIGSLLAEKYNNRSGSVQFGKAIYSAYKFALRDTFINYKDAKSLSLKNGDFLAATEPTVNESLTYLGAGIPLQKVEQKINENIIFCKELDMPLFRDFQTVLKHQLSKLKGENIPQKNINEANDIIKNTSYHFTRVAAKVIDIQRLCIHEKWEEAAILANNTLKDSQVLTGLHIFTEYNFYYALSLINQLTNLNGIAKFKAKRKIKSILKNMTKWAESAPENHKHKLEFLTNLLQSKIGDSLSSTVGMLKSAEEASALGFIQNSALIYSSLAHVYKTLNDSDNAKLYKDKSLELYNEWGYKEQ